MSPVGERPARCASRCNRSKADTTRSVSDDLASRTYERPGIACGNDNHACHSRRYYDAARDDVEYLFGDSITAISPDGEVRFENAAPRRFDLVVGADGLHSNLRNLVFGDESGFSDFIGAYFGVLTLPNTFSLDGELVIHVGGGQRAMAEHVRGSRAVALSAAKTLIPTSRLGVAGLAQGARLISALPAGPSRALLRLTTKSARVYNSMAVDDYDSLSPAAM